MFQILTLYIDCNDAKNIQVLYVPIWDFGGQWRFLPKVSTLTLKVQRTSMSFKSSFQDLDDAAGSSIGFWRMLEVPDWGLAS